MRFRNMFRRSALLCVVVLAGCPARDSAIPGGRPTPTVSGGPRNATYLVEGRQVTLVNGRSDAVIVPGSASKTTTAVFGEPVQGVLTDPRGRDAAIILTQSSGGSGTFYYVAAALFQDGEHRGTDAVLLGDRIALQEVEVSDGAVIARYAERAAGEAMSDPPTVARTRFFAPENGALRELKLLKGRIVWGHEVRTFQPCGDGNAVPAPSWIDGRSRALATLKESHETALSGSGPYAPLYVEIVGKKVEAPAVGFGSSYAGAILIQALTAASATGSCMQDLIVLENLVPGSHVTSPIQIAGKARGNWYFEGDFPVRVLDEHANVVGVGFATAQGEWMTEEFVPFLGVVPLDTTPAAGTPGRIVLTRSNPADMPENDDSLETLIYFGDER